MEGRRSQARSGRVNGRMMEYYGAARMGRRVSSHQRRLNVGICHNSQLIIIL